MCPAQTDKWYVACVTSTTVFPCPCASSRNHTVPPLAATLPARLGDWEQQGADQDLSQDPLVAQYLGGPRVALQRFYVNADGQTLALVCIGNRGEESFLLFSHTPEICYPSSRWHLLANRRDQALLDDHSIFARYLFAEHAETGQRLLTLYWYLWDNPERDSRQGVLSLRLNLHLLPGQSEAAARDRVWGFARLLFPATVAWQRY